MGVIEDNELIKAKREIADLARTARWVLSNAEARSGADGRTVYGIPEAIAELTLIVASQQKQIEELREQLRRMR